MLSKYKAIRLTTIKNIFQTVSYSFYSNSVDTYVQTLLIEECSRKEISLLKYFEHSSKNNVTSTVCVNNILSEMPRLERLKNRQTGSKLDLRRQIEDEMKGEKSIPNRKMHIILTYFVKNGDINGVKTIQLILEKHNNTHYKLYSEYKHYLAEALWIHGQIEDSWELFSFTYSNELVRPQVIVMIKCLFPLLLSQHSEALLYKTVCSIEKFSVDNNDFVILTYIWKELFLSDWFSDQQLSKEILQRNLKIISMIHFMIPSIGRMLLSQHKVDAFYRLFEFNLENDLNQDGTLIRLLFDYYCKYYLVFIL